MMRLSFLLEQLVRLPHMGFYGGPLATRCIRHCLILYGVLAVTTDFMPP